jgi:hypothetical protein
MPGREATLLSSEANNLNRLVDLCLDDAGDTISLIYNVTALQRIAALRGAVCHLDATRGQKAAAACLTEGGD